VRFRRKSRPSKELLEDLYLNKKLSIKQISKELCIKQGIIWVALKEYNIPMRHGAWNKNITKEMDERVARFVRAGQEARKDMGAWNKGLIIKTALVSYICLECGKEFQRMKCKPSKFCCNEHSRLYFAKHNRVSSFERKVEGTLNLLGLKEKEDYISQFPLNNWIVDFYLPKLKTIIECDGDYWHSLPDRQESDLKKDIWFMQNNYDILRLKENFIKNETDNCTRTIKDFIGVN
jgi:very-short-patch-repair endonuclease